MKYPIATIFRSLQGEGHFVGYPTTFVRLAGCSVLGCSIRAECDEAPWKATASLMADEILYQCRQLCPSGIVCLTGGEPFDHDLRPLVDVLTEARFRIHVETSGAREVNGLPVEWITVSPKTPDFAQRVGHTLKVVVRPGMGWRDIQGIDLGTTFFHRYLQPLTMRDGSSNLQEVIALLQEWDNYPGRWALSTQAHKTWALP